MSKYLSFKPLDRTVTEDMIAHCPPSIDKAELSDILESLSYMEDEVPEVAVCLLEDALAVRIFDGEKYLFISPIGLSDGWDIRGAIKGIAEYSVREMIPLVFTDVPRDSISVYSELFRFTDARVYDDDDDLFFVLVENECSALDETPEYSKGGITLRKIAEEDLGLYARLCRDRELNKYWGYDVSEDNLLDTDEFFLESARREFNTGSAITLGAYLEGEFIGEAVIYAFDYKGGASIALRILPEYHGQKLGQRVLSALISLSERIGLLALYGEAMVENLASIGMTSHFMENLGTRDGKVYFRKNLK